ncbi:MAG: peptidylprolyl isomerase [Desulfatitalea sp.]
MKRALKLHLAAAICIVLLSLAQTGLAESPPATEEILARVNGTAITVRDLNWELGQLHAEMNRRNMPLTDPQISALRPQLLENLIERELLFQHAQKKKIQARAQWVDAALGDLKGQLEGSTTLQSYLAASGMTQAQMKERLAKGVVVQRLLRQEAVRGIQVSEAEMQVFYREHPELFANNEKIRVRHILIAPKDANDAAHSEALEKIKALQRQIEQGSDFAILALEHSDCPSRAHAGDIGYLTRDQMVAPFADATFALAPGGVSDVVVTRFGYHLIKLIDRTPADPVTFRDAQAKIELSLRRDKESTAVKGYIATLKKQASIERLGFRR